MIEVNPKASSHEKRYKSIRFSDILPCLPDTEDEVSKGKVKEILYCEILKDTLIRFKTKAVINANQSINSSEVSDMKTIIEKIKQPINNLLTDNPYTLTLPEIKELSESLGTNDYEILVEKILNFLKNNLNSEILRENRRVKRGLLEWCQKN